MTLHDHLDAARQVLAAAGYSPDTAALDADVLARHVLGWDLARLLAHNREPAPDGFLPPFEAAIARRARREPVAYIVGHREFWGLDFTVTPATLIPRPETELIVEAALELLPRDEPVTVLDIGTGTGCLAVSLAVERPNAICVATDISEAALRVAAGNARKHGVLDRVRFVCTDLGSGLDLQATVIVSNPPYVPARSAPALLPDVGRYEPPEALFGGDEGLELFERLLNTTARLLAPGGTFIVEFGYGQEDSVRALAEPAGWRVRRVLEDLQGIARTLVLGR